MYIWIIETGRLSTHNTVSRALGGLNIPDYSITCNIIRGIRFLASCKPYLNTTYYSILCFTVNIFYCKIVILTFVKALP